MRIIGTTYPANQAGAALDYRRLTTATISDPLSRAVSSCRRTTREFSDSLTNDVRCGDAEGSLAEGVKDAIWVLRRGVSEAEIGRRLGVPKRTVGPVLAEGGRDPAEVPASG